MDLTESESEPEIPADPQEAADKAFSDAHAGFELFGKPLQPYSPTRKMAAQTMGLLYPYVGEAGAAQMERVNTYPGMLKDISILLWLCTLKDAKDLTRDDLRAGQFSPPRASVKPDDAFERATEWASEVGIIDMTGPKFKEASEVFMAIVQGMAASEFRLSLSTGETGGDGTSPKT